MTPEETWSSGNPEHNETHVTLSTVIKINICGHADLFSVVARDFPLICLAPLFGNWR